MVEIKVAIAVHMPYYAVAHHWAIASEEEVLTDPSAGDHGIHHFWWKEECKVHDATTPEMLPEMLHLVQYCEMHSQYDASFWAKDAFVSKDEAQKFIQRFPQNNPIVVEISRVYPPCSSNSL